MTLLPVTAQAYVPYRTDQGAEYHWEVSCVPATIYLNGFSQMDENAVARAVSSAAHTWSPDGVTCGMGATATHPYLEIVPTLSVDPGPPPPAMYDARNSIIFRTDSWTMGGKPNGKAYNIFALAITSVFAKPNGKIVDADVEINATDKYWVNVEASGTVDNGHGLESYDLQNTLTHEFGHFIGLDHTCFTPDLSMPLRIRPVDDTGAEIPDCSDAPEAVTQTVMFDSTTPLETSKRVLTTDEIKAVCHLYPQAKDPLICALDVPNDALGCRAAGPGPRRRGLLVTAAAALVGLAIAVARARRRRG
jgi:hypothetical protein